jgi:hypothetical protein
MKGPIKVLIILLCLSICTGGAMLSVRENAKDVRPKPSAMPIDNREPHHGAWIWA